MKKIAVVSLRFSPAHASHLFAYGKLIRAIGLEPLYILDLPYLRFADFAGVAPTVSAQAYLADPESHAFDAAIFYNAALNNASVARAMRNRGIVAFYIFHEPVPIRYRLAEGWKELAKLAAAKVSSLAMLRQSSAVLVPSGYARKLYDRHYIRHNPHVHTFPLIFSDEVGANVSADGCASRLYFSFLGLALKAHDFSGFLDFVKFAIRAGSTIPFTIATRTDLTSLLAADVELSSYVRQGKLRIQHGRVLSNEEMNRFSAESFCIWNIYTCVTQSGALARSFMSGTPVLANQAGSFLEYIRPGYNGEIIEGSHRYDLMMAAAEMIRRNLPAYVEGARRTFLETFCYSVHLSRFSAILEGIEKEPLECASH